ncbi:MAG: PEGA domain-containing protein [Myxococcales bacterium]|nr:PEGA domain-containing protein [Myxococcales bacterium]
MANGTAWRLVSRCATVEDLIRVFRTLAGPEGLTAIPVTGAPVASGRGRVVVTLASRVAVLDGEAEVSVGGATAGAAGAPAGATIDVRYLRLDARGKGLLAHMVEHAAAAVPPAVPRHLVPLGAAIGVAQGGAVDAAAATCAVEAMAPAGAARPDLATVRMPGSAREPAPPTIRQAPLPVPVPGAAVGAGAAPMTADGRARREQQRTLMGIPVVGPAPPSVAGAPAAMPAPARPRPGGTGAAPASSTPARSTPTRGASSSAVVAAGTPPGVPTDSVPVPRHGVEHETGPTQPTRGAVMHAIAAAASTSHGAPGALDLGPTVPTAAPAGMSAVPSGPVEAAPIVPTVTVVGDDLPTDVVVALPEAVAEVGSADATEPLPTTLPPRAVPIVVPPSPPPPASSPGWSMAPPPVAAMAPPPMAAMAPPPVAAMAPPPVAAMAPPPVAAMAPPPVASMAPPPVAAMAPPPMAAMAPPPAAAMAPVAAGAPYYPRPYPSSAAPAWSAPELVDRDDDMTEMIQLGGPAARRRWPVIAVTSGLIVIGVAVMVVIAARGGGGDGGAAGRPPAASAAPAASGASAPAAPGGSPRAGAPGGAVEPAAATTPPPAVESPPEPPPIAPGASPPPASGTCAVALSSSPEAVQVVRDGQILGETPFTYDGPCTPYEVTFRRDRYQPVTRQVAAGAAALEVRLERPVFEVKVTSRPSGATVTIGDVVVGKTPATIALPGFETTSLVLARRGLTATQRVYPDRDGHKVDVKLRRKR